MRPNPRGAAFTLIELMVVIGIFLILLLIAVPAFRSLLYSSEQSLADTAMRSGLNAARDLAARGRQGEDAAAVITYDAVTHKTSIIPCVRVGTLIDRNAASQDVEREVFAPVAGLEPVQLPRGWTIRGYAIPGSIDDDWYERTYPSGERDQGHWVFPETDFYDWEVANAGRERQTFIVRFEGGTGAVKSGDMQTVLVLNPAPTDVFRGAAPFIDHRADRTTDYTRFVRRIIGAPFVGATSLSADNRRALLGDVSTDTILAKPVRQLALCNEAKLAGGLSVAMATPVRLDPVTGCLYRDFTQPQFVTPLNLDAVSAVIEVRFPVPASNPVEMIQTDTRIFTIQRYLGTLQEITGTKDGQGVSQ
jgi:prepilin-type N-terminal cleavage/methylation domain-containing protein